MILAVLLAATVPELPVEALIPIGDYQQCTSAAEPAQLPQEQADRQALLTKIMKQCAAVRADAAARAGSALAATPAYADPARRKADVAAYLAYIDDRLRFDVIDHEHAEASNKAFDRCLMDEDGPC